MSKISDLASTLTDKFGLSTQDAEAFVATMFDVINDQLQSGDKSVKVKKLGTFKVTSVSSRESINVNTGERILIEGRNKISFTPDSLLKDRVNKPFSQFETVALNDGVDFADIEQEPEQENEKPKMEETKHPEQVTEHIETPEPTPQTTENTQPEKVAEEKEQETERPVAATEVSHDECHEEVHHHHHHSERHHHHGNERKLIRKIRTRNIVIVILLIIIAAMATVGYRYFNQYDSVMKEKDNRILELEIIMDNIGAEKAKKDAASSETTHKVEEKKAVAEPASKPTANAEKRPVEPQKGNDYNKDPRIRTGAYVITGIEQTVTMQPGQTLKSISRAILGDGMECYVEAVNTKREYKAGDKVNIPALRHKKIKSKR